MYRCNFTVFLLHDYVHVYMYVCMSVYCGHCSVDVIASMIDCQTLFRCIYRMFINVHVATTMRWFVILEESWWRQPFTSSASFLTTSLRPTSRDGYSSNRYHPTQQPSEPRPVSCRNREWGICFVVSYHGCIRMT